MMQRYLCQNVWAKQSFPCPPYSHKVTGWCMRENHEDGVSHGEFCLVVVIVTFFFSLSLPSN
jgi:hypothetical protein